MKALLTVTDILVWEETKSFLHIKVHLLPPYYHQIKAKKLEAIAKIHYSLRDKLNASALGQAAYVNSEEKRAMIYKESKLEKNET